MTEYYTAQLQQQMLMEVASAFLGFAVMIVIVGLLLTIASYVMESVGLYCIARNRGLKNPWMAWVPVLKYWLLGCVSDQYRYVVKGQIRNSRTVLLILVLLSTVIGWVSGALSAGNISMIADAVVTGYPIHTASGVLSSSLSTASLVGTVSMVAGIALKVLRYMALHDVYTSCDPHNNVLYLVLGILFDFLNPIFLFVCRNKDEGMPPRREAPQYQTEEAFTEV